MNDFTVQPAKTVWRKPRPDRPGVWALRGFRLGAPMIYEICEVMIAPDDSGSIKKGDLITNAGTDRAFAVGDWREWRLVSRYTNEGIRWTRLCDLPTTFYDEA